MKLIYEHKMIFISSDYPDILTLLPDGNENFGPTNSLQDGVLIEKTNLRTDQFKSLTGTYSKNGRSQHTGRPMWKHKQYNTYLSFDMRFQRWTLENVDGTADQKYQTIQSSVSVENPFILPRSGWRFYVQGQGTYLAESFSIIGRDTTQIFEVFMYLKTCF